MRKILFTLLILLTGNIVLGQTTYYWVGGTTPTTSISTGSNWNSALNGSGTSRPSSSGATDILIFDGTNVGGSTPATGTVDVLANGSITCAQMKFINNASVTMVRASTGTSTMNISGEVGDDFVIEAGASLSLVSQVGSLRFAMAAANTGIVSGTLRMITPLQSRIDNTTGGTGSLRFTSGSSFTTNITSSSSSYAFGSSSQSAEKWVVFENGSHLYYEGGYSPIGNNSTFSAIEFQNGSTYHHRANNGGGSFTNRRSFGNVSVENGAVLTADGPIFRINDLTIDAGCGFVTHTSGQTGVIGNLTVNGSYTSPSGSSNELVLAGSTPQTVSGTGTLHPASLMVANGSDISLSKNIEADVNVNILGKINFSTQQLTGSSVFRAEGINLPVNSTANTVAGNYFITGNSGIAAGMRGYLITGAGIPANTSIIAFSTTADTVYLSNAITATASNVSIETETTGATLETANTNAFNATSGSVITTGDHTYENNINYIFNAATTTPFGVTTGSSDNNIITGFTDINASVTTNKNLSVTQHLGLNGKFSLGESDTLHIQSGAVINGTPGSNNYIATGYNAATGAQAYIRYDGISAATLLPVGTNGNYLPVTVSATSSSDISITAFEGITVNGLVNGTPFNTAQLQTVVNAVWNINRLAGTGDVSLNFGWAAGLEGTGFSALPDSDIGVIQNTGTLWSAPLATGDNNNNTAAATVSTLGAFSIGAVAQVDPFVFNDLPVKIYGDVDFNGGATSLNTSQPIIYSSDNAAVATIVNGEIHITGAGTANITASQASDGFYPAVSVTKPLTVNKAALMITADDKTKFELLPNPTLTASYTGLVLGETEAVLLTPAVLSTTATTASPAGTYPITVSGATSNNYEISFTAGTLTVLPKQTQTITFNALPVKTYGNADFAAGATSTNATIPILYTSSNTSVATISGNMIHITGAGTTTITASQAGNDGYFPATDVQSELVVNKAPLTIRVRDTSKLQGTANPDFTITYSGFVLGETAAVLNPSPVINTIATQNSLPGYYALTPEGAGTNNYNITYTSGRLTINPAKDTSTIQLYVFINAAGNLNVRTYSPSPTMADIYLFDMNGKLVKKKNLFIPRGFINSEVPVGNIASGLYVVTVKGKEVNLSKTISILK